MKLRAALLMVLPATVLFIITFLIPLVMVGRLSFFKTDYMTTAYVGMQNYVTAVRDSYFTKSFVNSFVMVLMVAPMITVVAYKIASWISDYSEKVQAAARFLFYVPGLTSGLIMGLLWAWILDRAGLLNGILGIIGIPEVPWLVEVWPARASIVIASLSSGIGGYIILYSITMHSIPAEYQEQASVDGATRGQYKRLVQLPIMMPTIMLALLLSISGTMQTWETIYVLTAAGGPEGSTASPVYEIFMTAFMFGKAGLAAAKGVILLGVIAAILAVKQRVQNWLL